MKPLALKPIPIGTKATVSVPGSKSYTNRALLIAAITKGPVKIEKPLISDDTEAMLGCLAKLGIQVTRTDDYLEVIGDIRTVVDGDYNLDAHLSGTTIRFMLALCTIIPGRQMVRGGKGLHKRPIGDIVDSLRALGARIEYLETEGFPPLRVDSSHLNSGIVTVKGDGSSQFLSALLMIAPIIGDLTIETVGEVISKPYIDMTLETMKHFNVQVARKAYQSFFIAKGQTYHAQRYEVEGDVSSASYFFAIAALTRSTITVNNMNPHSIQADMGFLNILEQLGNIVSYGTHSITVQGTGVRCTNIDMEHCPDQAPTMAVLAAFASGTTTISGVQSLRVKETERIVALEQELAKMDIRTTSTHSTLVIKGESPQPATIATYGDHRMAMSFAVASTKLAGIKIEDPDVVAKTFPDFWKQLATLRSSETQGSQNIVLIGMRGSGKTTVAKQLAEALHREVIDIDTFIAKQAGQAVSQIVDNHGWNFFREQEAHAVKKVAALQDKIISTGGGVILRKDNVDRLKQHGFVIYLDTSAATLVERIRDLNDRPALTDQKTVDEEVKQILKEREKLYMSAADAVINTDDLNAEQVVQHILELTPDNAS